MTTRAAGQACGWGSLPQAGAAGGRWDTAHCGRLSGLLAAPATIADALAPSAGAAPATELGGYPRLGHPNLVRLAR